MIKYKEISTTTDMIISTGGYDKINFDRLISSSASPYLVDTVQSYTYRDDTSPIIEIYGLYIIDLNNAVYLIF